MTEHNSWTVPPGLHISDGSGGSQKPLVVVGTPAVGDTLVYDGANFVPAASGGESGAEQYVDFQLTDAQTRALPTAPHTVLPAPGDGLMYVFRRGVLYADLVVDYADVDLGCYLVLTANGDDPGVQRQHASNIVGLGNGWWLDGSIGPSLAFLTPKVQLPFEFSASYPLVEIGGVPRGDWNNQPLALAVSQAADFTGGDPGNTLSGRIWYSLVPTVPFGD